MAHILFDYSTLKGRIKEKFGSQKAFSKELGVTEATLISKLNGNSYFTQKEIWRSLELLDVEPGQLSAYFFAVKVQ